MSASNQWQTERTPAAANGSSCPSPDMSEVFLGLKRSLETSSSRATKQGRLAKDKTDSTTGEMPPRFAPIAEAREPQMWLAMWAVADP